MIVYYSSLQVEATEVFFAVTKLFQSKDVGLRRMVYLMIKELSPSADEVLSMLTFFVYLYIYIYFDSIVFFLRRWTYNPLLIFYVKGYYCYKLIDEGHEQ